MITIVIRFKSSGQPVTFNKVTNFSVYPVDNLFLIYEESFPYYYNMNDIEYIWYRPSK